MLLAEELVIKNPSYPSEIHISVQVDSKNKIIHLLDNDVPGMTSLSNAMNDKMLSDIKLRLSLDNQAAYRTFTYHTDGMICEYVSPGFFKHLDYDTELVHRLFKEECKARIEGY